MTCRYPLMSSHEALMEQQKALIRSREALRTQRYLLMSSHEALMEQQKALIRSHEALMT
jgi:hypothetical protein